MNTIEFIMVRGFNEGHVASYTDIEWQLRVWFQNMISSLIFGNTLIFSQIFNKTSRGFSHISAFALRCSPHTSVRTEDVNAWILHYKFIVK